MNEKIVAVVNGRNITQEEYNEAIAKFPKDRTEYFNTPEGKKQFLDQLISWELMFNYAVDNKYEQKDSYKQQLEEARRAILAQIAIQDIVSGVSLEDNEVIEYYNQNKEYFKEDAQVSARHILVDSLEKADEVIKQINNGMEFGEAAKAYSSCPSKSNGGSLGFFSRGMMVPEFEEAAFKLEKGVLSSPVQTQFGFHIILVDDKKEASVKRFEDVEKDIRNHMLQEKQSYVYMNFVNDLKGKYKVDIK